MCSNASLTSRRKRRPERDLTCAGAGHGAGEVVGRVHTTGDASELDAWYGGGEGWEQRPGLRAQAAGGTTREQLRKIAEMALRTWPPSLASV